MAVGPCTPYITESEFLADPRIPEGMTVEEAEPFVAEANETMYVLTGRQYPGACQATVRPVRQCLQVPLSPGWGASLWGAYDTYTAPWPSLLGVPECCTDGDPIPLSAPVRSVDSVFIDGAPFYDWYLDGNRLRRTDGRRWPDYRKVWLPDTEDKTFSIVYTFGPDSPRLLTTASLELAVQLYFDSVSSSDCQLPPATSSVSSQGITMTLSERVEQAREAGRVLPAINNALGTLNPSNQRQPPEYLSNTDDWVLHVVPTVEGS